MTKTSTGTNGNGKLRTTKIGRHREVELPITHVNTPGKRIARALWG